MRNRYLDVSSTCADIYVERVGVKVLFSWTFFLNLFVYFLFKCFAYITINDAAISIKISHICGE